MLLEHQSTKLHICTWELKYNSNRRFRLSFLLGGFKVLLEPSTISLDQIKQEQEDQLIWGLIRLINLSIYDKNVAKPKQLLITVTNKMSQSRVGNLEQLLKLSRVLIVSFPQDFYKTVSNADSIPAFSFHHLTFRPNSILTSSTYCQRTLKYWRRLSYSNFCGFSSNWILLYFPLFVCPSVCHRRDISHFSHI